ncbi:MAG: flagellar export protein FliJ [Pseudomonadota bacterium]
MRASRVARLGHLVGLLELKARHALHVKTLALITATERVDLLRDYQQDYEGKLLARGNTMNAEQLGNYHRFLDNLATAIKSQTAQVAERRRAVAAGEASWQEDRRKLESVRRVTRRRQQEVLLEETRVLQRQVDDMIGTRHATRSRN